MTMISASALRQVRSLDDLLEFLEEELDWPLAGLGLEEVSYAYTAAELGIDDESLGRLQSLRRLRPLSAEQPWGVIFAEFDGPRLPITPLRRLLQGLVRKKRAGSAGDRQTWDLDDLLFFVTTGAGEAIEIHLLAFFDADAPSIEIRSLPWRPRQSPDLHLERLAGELLPGLEWPADPSDTLAWRNEWRNAFKLRHGEAIGSAARLADRMAATAQALRSEIERSLSAEAGRGPLSGLMEEIREELVADVTVEAFADMASQTLVYGVLAARVIDPSSFGASPALAALPFSAGFLSALFERVYDSSVGLDLDEAGLGQLVADLRHTTNVEAVLDQFGSSVRGGDPVVHFYEEFLKAYDRRLRVDAGAFYTPRPVVRFMIEAVDNLLRTELGLSDGIHDATSWGTVAGRLGASIPPGVDPSQPFVRVLDPATGTGTFLTEWLRRGPADRSQLSETDLEAAVAPSAVGLELMLGPYAVANLKLRLAEHSHGGENRASVLLTDTLAHPPPEAQLSGMEDPVAAEGQEASGLKLDADFTVIVGNPPYGRPSAGSNAGRAGGVVRNGVPGVEPLIRDLLKPMEASGDAARHARSLYNAYVYFWRWATWQLAELKPKPGLVAFVTASSFLDGVSFRGLRQHLRETFDQLHIVDLGGDSRSTTGQVDENVFDIRIPVAICIGVRRSDARSGACAVSYSRVYGTRDEKFSALAGGIESLSFMAVEGAGMDPFVPSEEDDGGLLPLDSLLSWSARGIQFSRTWPVAEEPGVLRDRWDLLLEQEPDARGVAVKETRDVQASRSYKSFHSGEALPPLRSLMAGDEFDSLRRVGFRSFDTQWCIADRRVIDMPRPPLWRSALKNQIFLVTNQQQDLGNGPYLVASPAVPDLNFFNNRGGLVFTVLTESGEANFGGDIRSLMVEGTSPSWSDTIAFIYGCLGTPAAARYELSAGGLPAVPSGVDIAVFEGLVSVGRRLLALHLGERPTSEVQRTAAPPPSDYEYSAGDEILRVGDQVFRDVPLGVWSFEVGGMQVVKSWIGYRMVERAGRRSSPLDEIRPATWDWPSELDHLIEKLIGTLDLEMEASELLGRAVGRQSPK